MIIDGKRICPDCQELVNADEFSTSTGTRITYCKKCSLNRAALWRAANPEKVAAKSRRRVLKDHGITEQEYAELLNRQNGVCLLCKTDNPGGKNGSTFHIDHDHNCCPGYKSCRNCVRGLLCSKCNTAIGLMGDNPDLLRDAADYIEKFRANWKGAESNAYPS